MASIAETIFTRLSDSSFSSGFGLNSAKAFYSHQFGPSRDTRYTNSWVMAWEEELKDLSADRRNKYHRTKIDEVMEKLTAPKATPKIFGEIYIRNILVCPTHAPQNGPVTMELYELLEEKDDLCGLALDPDNWMPYVIDHKVVGIRVRLDDPFPDVTLPPPGTHLYVGCGKNMSVGWVDKKNNLSVGARELTWERFDPYFRSSRGYIRKMHKAVAVSGPGTSTGANVQAAAADGRGKAMFLKLMNSKDGEVMPLGEVSLAVNWQLKVDYGHGIDITNGEIKTIQTRIAYGYRLPEDALPESLRIKCGKDNDRRGVPNLTVEASLFSL
ncbi:hypothetical protein BT63DRAFT_481014 [Microthyrium microscopicum]|uniref:Uncharacterized protein n=1 Tax=Microthyrium microscopicum TaxID=703497 RepID=A0A6A6U2Z3_9PEZI|nr:hypothetical protein BT63DRAFT_481014 [Microthyrium microscopicum]